MAHKLKQELPAGPARRRAFTLLQIVVVVGIMMILAAITVPVFSRARESTRRSRCASNLQQIYLAVREYYQDTTRYPQSMAPLLPESANIIVVASGSHPSATIHGGIPSYVSGGHFGYLKSLDVLTCPNDDNEYNVPHSSYDTTGDPVSSVWNFMGYDSHGTVPDNALFDSGLLVNTHQAWDLSKNPVKFSLSNRLAPSKTVITHCRFHRKETVDVRHPDDIYNGAPANLARDMILRVDGTVKPYDVSSFNEGREPLTKWQQQDF